ncbi:30S ribosomal protein S20 [Candidatus Peregrinibacteria bacterium]|nr:30S ribosomal protein S20 [Candidatus Peregrinibacteria bacterium]
MPIIRSAKKALRQSLKKRERNRETLSKMKTYMRKVLDSVKSGSREESEKCLRQAYIVIDKALKKNMIHKNNAARKKSRMARVVAKAFSGKKEAKQSKETA